MKSLKVNFSKNYNLFEFGNLNRETSKSNLKAKITSIKKYGCLSPITVALINGKYKIIDGKHRFLALQELKMEIPFVLMDAKTELEYAEIMTEMNNNLKKWNGKNFIDIHAKTGNEIYIKMLEFMDVYDEFKLTALMNIWNLNDRRENSSRHYLDTGLFVVEDWDASYEFAEMLRNVGDYCNFNIHFQFIKAYSMLVKDKNYDHPTFLNQLHAKGVNPNEIFRGVANVYRFLELMVNIYNKQLNAKNRVNPTIK